MIVASILKNYKCYNEEIFISFVSQKPTNMNVIIGNNGVGKSAILEAMDSFFNDADWIVNSKTKNEVSVGLVFLLQKTKTDSKITIREKSFIETISDLYWNESTSNDDFEVLKERIQSYKNDYYLVCLMKKQLEKDYHLIQFDSLKWDVIEALPVFPIKNLLLKILNFFSFLYIPVESSVPEFLKLETQGLQTLMNKSIKDAINKALNNKRINRKKKKISVLQIINEELEAYIHDAEVEIQKINTDYNYNLAYKQTKQLTANHVTEAIIDSFYRKRRLKKGNTSIETLSSGEKRVALIDIIYVFSSQNNNPEKELIIAIDEPENSLNVSNCYNQFEKLTKIAGVFHHQIFLTTHWYGALPVLYRGNLLHINEERKVSNFDLYNYYEERKHHPDDIQIKGYFDFVSSLLNAFRNDNYNWLLVEGKEDKKYLEYYLQKKIPNIRIIPLGGCSNVKKKFDYLYTSMMGAGEDFMNAKNNKIICLVDTDSLCTPLSSQKSYLPSNHPLNMNLKIFRLDENMSNHEILLKKIEDHDKNPTEIEECLNSKRFYDALELTIDEFGSKEEKTAFSSFEFDVNVKNSRIKGDYSILNPITGNASANKSIICGFIDNHKDKIANTYISLEDEDIIPEWILKLIDYFNK